MAEEITLEKMPYTVGKMTSGWLKFAGASLLLVLVGLAAWIYQLREGLIVTGMRDVNTMEGTTWGLYVVFDIYFVGISFAGITVAALIRIFGLKNLKPMARMAEWLTVIALLLGGLAIMADLGQPFRALINLPKYGRPQSPFFGTFTMVVAGYFFSSLVFLYLDSRRDSMLLARMDSRFKVIYRWLAAGYKDTPTQRQRHHKISFYLALAIIPLLITAHTSLGLIFGLQVGRPGWFSALQGPAFVVLAGISGLGMLIILAAIIRKVLDEKERLNMDIFIWLGKAVLVLSLIYLYMTIAETATSLFTGHHAENQVADAVLWGTYAPLFWLAIGALVLACLLIAWQGLKGQWRLSWLVICGLLVQVTAIGKRYLIVVPSQTHGSLLTAGVGSYSPTWVEYAIIIGIFGLGALMFAVMMYFFPIMPIEGSRYETRSRKSPPEDQIGEGKPPDEEETMDEAPVEITDRQEAPALAESPEAVPGGGA